MPAPPLRVAWISDFSIEWLDGLPPALAGLPRQHPLTWQRVLLDEFSERSGLELHVIVLRKGIERDVAFERKGIHFQVLKTRGLTRAPSLYWTDTWMIRRTLEQIQPHLVHAWGTERGAALVGLRLPWPCLVTIQGLLSWYNSVLPPDAWRHFGAMLEDHALRRAGHVTTESSFAVNYLRKRHPRLTVHQVEHAPGRVFHEVARAPRTRPVRLMVTGHLDRRKGADALFLALDSLLGETEFEVVHVGTADRRLLAGLRSVTSEELWSRYHPLGSLAADQVAAELSRATLFVLPTRADTSPNAVKEAVVAGVPVVATAVGGIPDYVTHGENGWLIPAVEKAVLAEALRAALRHPLLGRGEVAPATLARVRDYLSPQRMAENFQSAYAAVLTNNSPP